MPPSPSQMVCAMEPFTSLVTANDAYVASGAHQELAVRPARALAIVTCMDARIAVFPTLGLALGDAHVIRTAGARVTEDVRRSLALSTHALGTRAVAVIGHTDCGVRDPDGDLSERLTTAMGRPPEPREWYAFTDIDQAVRDDCDALLAWPDRPEGFTVAGYVLDVTTGQLREVAPPRQAPDPAV